MTSSKKGGILQLSFRPGEAILRAGKRDNRMATQNPISTMAAMQSGETGALADVRVRSSRIRTARRRRSARPDWLEEIAPRVRALAGIVSLPEGKSDGDLVREAVEAKYNALP